MKTTRWLKGLAAGGGLICTIASTRAPGTTGPDLQALPAAQGAVPALTGDKAIEHLKATGEFDSLQAAITAARYGVKTGEGPAVSAAAANPVQGFSASFTPEGLRLQVRVVATNGAPVAADAQPASRRVLNQAERWRREMERTRNERVFSSTWRLASMGYGPAQLTVPAGTLKVEGQRVELVRDTPAVTEWFINTPGGLEHGFTLHERPAAEPGSRRPESAQSSTARGESAVTPDQRGLTSAATGGEVPPLRLVLAVSGDLAPHMDRAGQPLELRDAVGRTVFCYGDIKAWDATGAELPSAMEVGEGSVTLAVNDTRGEYPLTIDPLFTSPPDLIRAGHRDAEDWFGAAVAVSEAADIVAVGSPLEDSNTSTVNGDDENNRAQDAGAVFVFVRTGLTWGQQGYLKASHAGAGDHFGASVAISGETIVVGAPREDSSATGVGGDQDNNSAPDSGAVYVFSRHLGSWLQQAYLKASNAGTGDLFGTSVAISGNTLAVGAFHEASSAVGVNPPTGQSDNSAPNAGAAYAFVRTVSGWSQEAYLKASNTDAEDLFGLSVGISGDTLVVGAVNEASAAHAVNGGQLDNTAPRSGAAYVFRREAAAWSQEAYLKATDSLREAAFGASVAVSADRVVVGAPYAGDALRALPGGAAYVFVRNEIRWSQEAILRAAHQDYQDWFGGSVAIAGDMVVVGAEGEDSAGTGVDGEQEDNSYLDTGAVYVFVRSGRFWDQRAYLKPSDPGSYHYCVANCVCFFGGGGGSCDPVLSPDPANGTAYFGGGPVGVRSPASGGRTLKPIRGNGVATASDWVIGGAIGSGLGGEAYVFHPLTGTEPASPGTISVSLSSHEPLHVGDDVIVTVRIDGHTDLTQIDGFDLYLSFPGILSFLDGSLQVHDAAGPAQNWLRLAPQDGVTPGPLPLTVSSLLSPALGILRVTVTDQRPTSSTGTAANGGFLFSFVLHADNVGIGSIDVSGPVDGPALRDTRYSAGGVPEFRGGSVTVLAGVSATPGRIYGWIDMLRETEVVIPSPTVPNTLVSAAHGPGGSHEEVLLPPPYYGGFLFDRLTPSSAVTPASPYQVGATMHFRTGRRLETFTTPILGQGGNPAVPVPDGSTVVLGNTFVMNPGYVQGAIFLQGPAEGLLGHSSPLRDIVRWVDRDEDGDDVPDVNPDGDSRVSIAGKDVLAAGAIYTAAGGAAFASFQGDFHPGTSAFVGDYELVLAGLASQPSVWDRLGIKLLLNSTSPSAGPEPYLHESLLITERRSPDYDTQVQVAPESRQSMNLNYCLSEVELEVELGPDEGTLYSPTVSVRGGGLNLSDATARDFLGNVHAYLVRLEDTSGTPTAAGISPQGRAVVLLPAGEYDLRVTAQVQNPSGGISPREFFTTTFRWPASPLKVGCGQRLRLCPDLRVEITRVTPCLGGGMARVEGRASTPRTGNVSRIDWLAPIAGGEVSTLCTECDSIQPFDFMLPVDRCSDTPFTVLAHDSDGHSASASAMVPAAGPPEIAVEPDKTILCGSDWSFGPVRATGSCGSPAEVRIVSTTSERVNDTTYRMTRTWEAVDCHRTSRASQVVTLDSCYGGPPSIPLISSGSPWHYVDNGAAPSASWLEVGNQNESGWGVGVGPFGYGLGGEATLLEYGPQAANKYTTAYFRNTFEVTDAASLYGARLRLRCDDGAVVYLNGTEIYRSNMPTGMVHFATLATQPAVGPEERTFVEFIEVDSVWLRNGANVLAAEVHQFSAASPDTVFDLELLGQTQPPPSMTLPVEAGFSLFANPLSQVGKTLNEIFPIALDCTVELKWDSLAKRYLTNVYDGTAGSWLPNPTLEPGEGVVLYSPAPQSFTFASPLPIPPNRDVPRPGAGLRLVSCRTPVPSSFREFMGFEPMVGDRVLFYDGPLFTLPNPESDAPTRLYEYRVTGWHPAPPPYLLPGQAVFVDLVAIPELPTLLLQPQSQTAPEGAPVTFTAFGYGAGPLAYQWQRNSQPIADWTTVDASTFSAELDLPAKAADDGSVFSLLVSNSSGTTASAGARLTVDTVEGETGLLAVEDFNYAVGGLLNGYVGGAAGLDGGVGWAGAWTSRFANSGITVQSPLDPQVPGLRLGGGSMGEDLGTLVGDEARRPLNQAVRPDQTLWFSAILQAPASPVGMTSHQDDLYFFFDLLDLNAGDKYLKFSAYRSGSAQPMAWSLAVRSPQRLQTVMGPPLIADTPTLLVARMTPITPAGYLCELWVNPDLGTWPGPPPVVAITDTGLSFATVAGVEYLIGTFQATSPLAHRAGPIRFGTSYQAVVPASLVPAITLQPQPQDIAEGAPVIFRVGAVGAAPLGYQWFKDGRALPGQTETELTLPAVSFADAGSYACRIMNALGEVTSSAAQLTVHLPLLITSQPQSQTVADGAPVTLSVSAAGTWPFSYQWFKDGQPLPGYTDQHLSLPRVTQADAGTYYCLVTDAFGQATSSSALLTVLAAPFTANLLAYDSFSYPPDAQVIGQNGGAGWTGAWTGLAPIYSYFTNRPPSLVPAALPEYGTAGGSAVVDLPANSYDYLNRPLDIPNADYGELWVSAVIAPSGEPAGDRLLLYFDDNFQTRVEVGTYRPDNQSPARWTILQQPSAMGPVVQPDRAVLLVLRIQNLSLTSHQFDLYVNPAPDLIPSVPDGTLSFQGPRFDRIRAVSYVVQGGGTHHFDEVRIATRYPDVNPFSGLLSARDDTFAVPVGWPVVIPVSSLMANDGEAPSLPLYFSGFSPSTVNGTAVFADGSPVTSLILYPFPEDLRADAFSYRVSDGLREANGTVHLVPAEVPVAPAPNQLGVVPPPAGGGFTVLFEAPDAGAYALERKALDPPDGVEARWTEIGRSILAGPGGVSFMDQSPSTGALYRMRSVP